jgi:protein subunit release factor A
MDLDDDDLYLEVVVKATASPGAAGPACSIRLTPVPTGTTVSVDDPPSQQEGAATARRLLLERLS